MSIKHPVDFYTHIGSTYVGVCVTHYDKGTQYPIHTASTEDNDPVEFDFLLLDPVTREVVSFLDRLVDESKLLDEYLASINSI